MIWKLWAQTISGHRHLLSASVWTRKKEIKVWRWSLGSSSGWQDDASLFKLLYHIACKILPYRISGCQVKTDSKHQHNKMQQPKIISLNICAYYNTNISTTFHNKYHAEEEKIGYKQHISCQNSICMLQSLYIMYKCMYYSLYITSDTSHFFLVGFTNVTLWRQTKQHNVNRVINNKLCQ